MKYLVFILLLVPLTSAELNSFEDGTLNVEYPEVATPGEEVTISYTLSLDSNSVDQILQEGELGVEDSLSCKGLSLCDREFSITMGENPITIGLLISLEEGTGTQSGVPNTESEFVFEVWESEDTNLINKRFTILPAQPQVRVVETSPYLNDEIVDKVNELNIREITKEKFLEEIELGKNLKVTKNIDFERIEKESGLDIVSKWTITIEPREGIKSAKNVYVFEDVPKEGAYTDDEIIGANPKFTVLRRDPLIMWHFEEVDEPVEITFETDNVGITGAATAITAEEIDKGNIWQIIVPLLLIPIIGFILIYFGKFKKD